MNACTRTREVEVRFDTGKESDELRRHVDTCSACREHLRFLESTRSVLRREAALANERQPINADRFIADLGNRLETEPRHLNPRWALVSAAAAACIVALSLLSIFAPTERAVEARSYVESAQTDIEGATTQTYHADDGTAIVWVNVPEGDMW